MSAAGCGAEKNEDRVLELRDEETSHSPCHKSQNCTRPLHSHLLSMITTSSLRPSSALGTPCRGHGRRRSLSHESPLRDTLQSKPSPSQDSCSGTSCKVATGVESTATPAVAPRIGQGKTKAAEEEDLEWLDESLHVARRRVESHHSS